MRIWALISQKGGAGKTSICLNLAVHAEQQKEVCCVIDLDPQTNAVSWADKRGGKKPMVFTALPEKVGDVVNAARTVGATLCLIDVPSKLDAVALAAIRVSDLIITPTRGGLLHYGALEATAKLIALAGRLDDAIAVINAVEPGKETIMVGEALAELDRFKMAAAPVHISKRPPVETAINKGKGVTETNPKGPSAEEIRELWVFLDKLTTAKAKKKAVVS